VSMTGRRCRAGEMIDPNNLDCRVRRTSHACKTLLTTSIALDSRSM
jgi:hypothetical protein